METLGEPPAPALIPQQQESPDGSNRDRRDAGSLLDDMEAILAETASTARTRVVMLSGGTDSFVLVAVLRHLLGDAPLHTVTIRGNDPRDAEGADAVAAHFRTAHVVRQVTVDEIVAHLDLVGGTGYQKMTKVFSHICYQLALTSCDIAGATVYAGHAVAISRRSSRRWAARSCSRTAIRASRTSAEFRTRCSARPGSALSRTPCGAATGLGDIVERRRASIQEGTGLYDSFKARLGQLARTQGLSRRELVARLSA